MKLTRLKIVDYNKHSGFTLMEVMIVIAIIAITSLITLPTILGNDRKVKKVARGLLSDMHFTRMSAINSNTSWSIVFDTAGNSYSIYSDTTNTTLVKTVSFSEYDSGVVYGLGPAGSNQVPEETQTEADGVSYLGKRVTFNSMGTSNNGYVYITHNNYAYALGSYAATGNIKIRRWSGGGWQ